MTYLRFGEPPASGRSVMWPLRGLEAGVSVFEALPRRGGGYVVRLTGWTLIGDLYRILGERPPRPAYVAEGRVVGRGEMGGEPLLADVRLTERVGPRGVGFSHAGICELAMRKRLGEWAEALENLEETNERRTA